MRRQRSGQDQLELEWTRAMQWPAPAQGVAIFPEQLRIGDRFTNADGEWEVVPLTFRALGWRRES